MRIFSQTYKDEAYVHFIGVNRSIEEEESHRHCILFL